MRPPTNKFTAVAAIVILILGIVSGADAQRRNERQVRDLVRTLNAQIDDFQYGLDYQLRNTSSGSQDADSVHDSIRNLQTKVDDLQENLNNRKDNRDDIHEIISAAKDVDLFLVQNPQNKRIDTSWQGIRASINSLALNYGVTANWDGRGGSTRPIATQNPDRTTIPPPRTSAPAVSGGLTGTYQLDAGRSENIADILSSSDVENAQRQDLESKLEAPEQIAIDVRGNEITLASSKAPAVSFVADGREKTEQANGRTIRLKATLRGQELTITSLGGETDYAVTFVAEDSGRTLKVTRRITTDYLTETVFASSVYSKTDEVAGLGIVANPSDAYSDNTDNRSAPDNPGYSSNDPTDRPGANTTVVRSSSGKFVVPSGTIIIGFLESSIDTKVAQNNERFILTVQSPDQFRGATIDGYLTRIARSGRVSGRSNVTFNFESITLRNGQRYDFAGYLQGLKDQTGKTVKIDAEGTARGGSQTKQTVKRGGIGAGIGAVIGAIMGGGTGAAIGAVIGGGAGAGSVLVQGKDDLKLTKGSMMTIQATSPSAGNRRVADDDN